MLLRLISKARTHSISRVLSLLLLTGYSQSTATVPLPKNLSCPSKHFFDYAGLKCFECNTHVCGCPSTSLLANVECSIDELRTGQCQEISCTDECDTERVVSRDRHRCIPCTSHSDGNSTYTSSAYYDTSSSDCSCRNPPKGPPTRTHLVTKKLVEIYDDFSGSPMRKDCLRCPERTAVITTNLYNEGQETYSTAGKRFVADPYMCGSCPDPHMFFDTDYSCVCDDGYFLTGEASIGEQSCIKNTPSVSTFYSKVRFRDPISMLGGDAIDFTLESLTFSHMYTKAAAECEFYEGSSDSGLQSCQALGNLCVLSMYDEDTPACKQFSAISARRVGFYHGIEDWKYTLPWLFYRDEGDRVINDRSINMKVSFHREANQVNILQFKLAKYTVNGTFVGIEDLTNQFEFCSTTVARDADKSQSHWSGFGMSYRREYSCKLDRLLEKDMFLYDLYLLEERSDSCNGDPSLSDCLYPVPVLIRNLVKDNQFPNFKQQPDGMDDIYTRRFFLFDNESGKSWSGTEAIRYANKIVLQIQTQFENPSKLYPPILSIQYATATSSTWSGNGAGAASLMFHVEYSMKTDNFWASMKIVIGFLFAVGVVIFCIRMANWQSRQKNDIDTGSAGSTIGLWFAIHAFMILCHSLSMLFFLFLFSICAYWFVFFKLQHDVFLLLPPENELSLFEATLHTLFWCQTVYVAYVIGQQCQSDIFFVDWELCKRSKRGKGISNWRLLLIADLWNRMQAMRRSNITFSLVFIGFVMTGLGQHQNAIPRPLFQYNDNAQDNNNIALGFANTVIFWVAAAIIQTLWRFVVHERFLQEPISTKFVDLCTVCNISVFIMMENHKGYYLHGKSPHQCAECSMEELLKSLDREGRGVLEARSLEGASDGCQTYDFYASPAFRRQIYKIYSYARLRQKRFFFRSNINDPEKVGFARDELTLFLQSFIDRQPPPSRDGLRYVVRESWLAERLLGITPNDFRTKSEPTCILHPDNCGFLSSSFLGIEVEIDLLIHDILTYNVASMTFNNVGTSLILTYMVHLARTFLRSWFGQKNLSEKALIDERFLG